MLNQKNVIIASVAFVLVGLYLVSRKRKDISENQISSSKNTSTDIDTVEVLNRKKVLSKGTVSPEVGELQMLLGGLKVDNNFGSLTEARLKAVTGRTSISLEGYRRMFS